MVMQTIQIFARVKPSKKSVSVYSVENEENGEGNLEFVVPRDLADGFINNKRENYRFRFQKVFDQATKQDEIFETIAKPVADSFLAGYNGTVFAYGQTGSGKTFTITGGPKQYSDRGIIPRTLSYLYQHFSQDSSMVYTTHISYLEIYNEVGYDLLDARQEASNMEDLPKVTIMEDTDQNIHLKNLSLQPSANEEEALNLLFLGDTNRMIAETPMNQASTRSHCIFTIHLCSREPGSATVRRSKLHLVDLAGSERVGKTGVGGQILTEAKYINLSLLYLEQVITALSEKNRSHIPYRNSVMTSVLRDSLGGNCMTTMIATVSVEKSNIDESISTCRFAQRVAMIKNQAVQNEELDPSLLIARMKKEIQRLKAELAMVTGEQRSDDLTHDEIQRLEKQVAAFLDDSDPDGTLDLGSDMRKIYYCFSTLKVRVQSAQEAIPNSPQTSSSIPDAEVEKLKNVISQRDSEISVLLNMLKKEKSTKCCKCNLKVEEAKACKASASAGDVACQSSLQSSSSIAGEERCKKEISEEHTRPQHLKSTQTGPELFMDRQEAFEMFSRRHEDHLTISDNKAILKERIAEAKGLGEQLKEIKNRVCELKKQLEKRRMQMAVQDMTGEQTKKSDPTEKAICHQINEEKRSYERIREKLKGLKTEIEHLQHLLQKSKIKLQREFDEWWLQEIARIQQEQRKESTAMRLTPDTSSYRPFSRSSTTLQTHAINTQDRKQRNLATPSTDLRVPSEAKPLFGPLPLTGDPLIDKDIQDFIKARDTLLKKRGLIGK